ncbi:MULTISPECIES: poly-gamma-glutamate hydrolase family protein [unclassified Oceanobacillus]|uniref:poly-gamma-glutamate hydrolase family protein n=1 Tax=unclassified Oceanobacillus TaxID=2630292 RepID=UPI001BE6083D|nr:MULTISPECIES: poly-gamma-glutamate hydrolase family protein [unclassified Oceanobacillus]MBT2600049.1 poly-gamma-glutamate hydrolase family protein [Oceanobacillus sp. ISL-74]MBT2652503.1 poly-gamma-glutamate hydrolase family protein [Oceanobacillus sp. ISL-73]
MRKNNRYAYIIFLPAFLCLLLYGGTHYISLKYNSYEELKEHEELNEDYEINYSQRDSDITVIAIHGGGIEPGTSELAKGVADRMDLSYYLFEGIKQTGNMILHIESTRFDEPIGRNMVQESVSALSIHGYQGEESMIFLGGRNEAYREAIRDALQQHGFAVEDAPSHISGMSEDNIVNDTQLGEGVQLELTAGLRDSLFVNGDRSDTTAVYDELMESLEEGTNHYLEML